MGPSLRGGLLARADGFQGHGDVHGPGLDCKASGALRMRGHGNGVHAQPTGMRLTIKSHEYYIIVYSLLYIVQRPINTNSHCHQTS